MHTSALFAPTTLARSLVEVLSCTDPMEKARLARATVARWRNGVYAGQIGTCGPDLPDTPGRPARPELLAPREMPRRSAGGEKGRFALLHSLAHIELNAIDLAFDIVARFGLDGLPEEFIDDWLSVGDDEARHFMMIEGRLTALGGNYGDLPAHAGLWEAAEKTKTNLLARLALVPMVLEARGLDVTPTMITRLQSAGDEASASAIEIIYRDEQEHVRTGVKWFSILVDQVGGNPTDTFHNMVKTYFKGALKPPFNHVARNNAGLFSIFYEPLAENKQQ